MTLSVSFCNCVRQKKLYVNWTAGNYCYKSSALRVWQTSICCCWDPELPVKNGDTWNLSDRLLKAQQANYVASTWKESKAGKTFTGSKMPVFYVKRHCQNTKLVAQMRSFITMLMWQPTKSLSKITYSYFYCVQHSFLCLCLISWLKVYLLISIPKPANHTSGMFT